MQTVIEKSLQLLINDIDPDKAKPLTFQEWCKVTTPDWTWDWPQQLYLYPYLEKVLTGEIPKLIINAPPRHTKTELVTVRLPGYFLDVFNPSGRVMLGAYNHEYASEISRNIKRNLEGRVGFSKERNSSSDWMTDRGGAFMARGVKTAPTGRGGDLILVDDPTKSQKEADSKAYQRDVYEWFTQDLSSRKEPGARMIITMTRWNYSDLIGQILDSEDGPNWTVVNMPAIAEKDDPLGRQEGEALCPDRYPITELLQKKKEHGVKGFTALYQGKPTANEGAIFKTEYWNYYDAIPDRSTWEQCVISWDTAFKKGTDNDYSVGVVFIKTSDKIYVRHVLRKRLDFPELKRQFDALAREFKPDAILIEDKASGQSLIQELRDNTTLPVIATKADIDKEARANAVSPMVEAGNVYLPRQAHWLQDFIEELNRFPKAPHDDQVDAFVHGLNYLRDQQYVY